MAPADRPNAPFIVEALLKGRFDDLEIREMSKSRGRRATMADLQNLPTRRLAFELR